jgi:magnesium transporter
MLTAHQATAQPGPSAGAGKPVWLDLLSPSSEERADVERRLGLTLPSREDLSEVETSSRVSEENGVLYLSMPAISPASAPDEPPAPVGFVLSRDMLVTIRYAQLRAFDAAAAKFSKPDAPATSVDAFAALIDEMVDLSADLLEKVAADLDTVSRLVFPRVRQPGRRRRRSNEALRELLTDVGRAGERLSRIRDSLLSLQRIVPYVSGPERDWISPKLQTRLKTAQTDLVSLTDFETHLSGKVQFLLDAVLGFISTRQNEIFTVLTIVSVVGIPPTLVAGIYGMNFKYMPELEWAWGYPYGLAVIALSTVMPLLWFKWRGWL